MKRLLYIALLALVCDVAQAAKVGFEGIAPTQNTDGTPLTDLGSIKVEWGSCSGTAFGTYQASIILIFTTPGGKFTGFAYPSGMTKVCLRAYAINTSGVSSVASNVASKDLLPATGKPVTLGQPVILNFVQPEN